MHWICDALRQSGWHVRFITCDYSYLTLLKGDRRTAYGRPAGINRLERVDESLSLGVISTPWHPLGRNSSLAGRVANAVTSIYPWPQADFVGDCATGVDLVIVESCGALMMIDAIRKATHAPIVYRVSDNLSVVRPVPALLAAERRALSEVEVVSMASAHLARFLGVGSNLQIDPMGLDKALFDLAHENPYPKDGRVKVVISGSSGLDRDSLRLAAESHSDWDFIQFGAATALPRLANISVMGERPFKELVPWVKFADIGFAPYAVRPGFEYQAEHSNRLLQYVYCRLPSVVPDALASEDRPHYLGYRAGDKSSISAALDAAVGFDRTAVPADSVLDWGQLAARLAQAVGRERNEA